MTAVKAFIVLAAALSFQVVDASSQGQRRQRIIRADGTSHPFHETRTDADGSSAIAIDSDGSLNAVDDAVNAFHDVMNGVTEESDKQPYLVMTNPVGYVAVAPPVPQVGQEVRYVEVAPPVPQEVAATVASPQEVFPVAPQAPASASLPQPAMAPLMQPLAPSAPVAATPQIFNPVAAQPPQPVAPMVWVPPQAAPLAPQMQVPQVPQQAAPVAQQAQIPPAQVPVAPQVQSAPAQPQVPQPLDAAAAVPVSRQEPPQPTAHEAPPPSTHRYTFFFVIFICINAAMLAYFVRIRGAAQKSTSGLAAMLEQRNQKEVKSDLGEQSKFKPRMAGSRAWPGRSGGSALGTLGLYAARSSRAAAIDQSSSGSSDEDEQPMRYGEKVKKSSNSGEIIVVN